MITLKNRKKITLNMTKEEYLKVIDLGTKQEEKKSIIVRECFIIGKEIIGENIGDLKLPKGKRAYSVTINIKDREYRELNKSTKGQIPLSLLAYNYFIEGLKSQ